MNKVNLGIVTKELTIDQVEVHNGNYSALADKDLEIYNELKGSCGKIYNAVIVSNIGTTEAQRKNADFIYTGSEDINAFIQGASIGFEYYKKVFKFVGFFSFNAGASASKIVMPANSYFDGTQAEIEGIGGFNCFEAADNCIVDGFRFYGCNDNMPVKITGNYVSIINCKIMDNGDVPSLCLAVTTTGNLVRNCDFNMVDIEVSGHGNYIHSNVFMSDSNAVFTSSSLNNFFLHNVGVVTVNNSGIGNIVA